MRASVRRLRLLAGLVLCSGAALFLGARFAYRQWQNREPTFHDNFDRESYSLPHQGGWEAFGGTWEMQDGTMQNISDDRGAKLLNGRAEWRDYEIEADVQLLSETGDAGFVIRTSTEEVGVDAYHGYFAGLRDLDDTLIIGRADFGWHEFPSVLVRSHIHTRTWYHLKVIALGCDIAASAITPEGETAVASVHDEHCIRQGRFGLQSYSTGAVWRNLEVRPATQVDLSIMLNGAKPPVPNAPLVDASNIPVDPPISNLENYQRVFAPMRRELRDNHADLSATPIANLRLLPPNVSPHVTIHGVVTLVSPLLFIQDSSGGISVPAPKAVIPVQIGDAVEASGDAELHSFSSVLRNASVRLLWSHTQLPAMAVTASQGATGSFDAQFIETEGRLTSVQREGSKSVTLQLDEGNQSFLAIVQSGTSAGKLPTFRLGSRLRLRGICVVDKSFTGGEVPFAVLMRSGTDVQMLAPPPWWNTAHIVELTVCLFVVLVFIQIVYSSFQRSRLRAVMDERERLAMEMHDTLAQSFAGLGFQLEALSEEAPPGSSMRSQLQSTVGLVRFAHKQARSNISAVRPANLEQLGLAGALEQAARSIVQGGPVTIDLAVRGEPRTLPLQISDTLFRIGQEAIANSVRHGHPAAIRIRLAYGKDSVQLTVHDNGQGFCPGKESSGFGMQSMRQRAEHLGANFRVRSTSGHGTVVIVRVRSSWQMLSSLGSVTRNLRKRYLHAPEHG